MSRELLENLEWSSFRQGPGSGFMDSGGDGAMVSCCPSCKGVKPDYPNAKSFFIQEVIGHRNDCELASELKKPGGNNE